MAYRVFDDKRLLEPPVKRAAYSDRMALLMAEMSKLAYVRFENLQAADPEHRGGLDRVLASIKAAPDDARALDILETLVRDEGGTYQATSREALEKFLDIAGYSLVDTYDHKDTQAFLAVNDPDKLAGGAEKIAVLSFRGTEKNVGDIKTDLNLGNKTVDGVRVTAKRGGKALKVIVAFEAKRDV